LKAKKYILVRKQYVDRDGLLVQGRKEIEERRSKMKVMSQFDLAHKSDEGLETPAFAKPLTTEHSPSVSPAPEPH